MTLSSGIFVKPSFMVSKKVIVTGYAVDIIRFNDITVMMYSEKPCKLNTTMSIQKEYTHIMDIEVYDDINTYWPVATNLYEYQQM